MQPISSSSSSSSSTSTSSHSSGERHSGMEKFERMRFHSPPSPPPHHFKGKKHHHHPPRPPHHHHHHHHHHFVSTHRHHSAPPLCSLHCEKAKLRVKPPKPSKKVRKLHHKLMHQHYHVPPAPGSGFFSADAAYEHRLGCCVHYHGMSMADERPAEERRQPHEVGVLGHRFGHLRPPHAHKRHPCTVKPPPMLPPAEPPIEADAPPPSLQLVAA